MARSLNSRCCGSFVNVINDSVQQQMEHTHGMAG
jgi:hypothetical protein